MDTNRSNVHHAELESTIEELRRQLAQQRLANEESEQKASTRLADLRAQLVQSDAANRSLQAYLTFLKRSYTSIFDGDSSLPTIESIQPPPQTQVGATSATVES